MSNEIIGRKPEIEREESRARFLELFSQVSGMKLQCNLSGEEVNPSGMARLARVKGALVVGSCTHPDAKPKDLDIVFFLDGPFRTAVLEYAEEVKYNFDLQFSVITGSFSKPGDLIQMGRLDVIGFVDQQNNPSVPWVPSAIRDIEDILIFAFNFDEAKSIVSKLKF